MESAESKPAAAGHGKVIVRGRTDIDHGRCRPVLSHVTADGNTLCIRFDDEKNLSFWLEATIPLETLRAWLLVAERAGNDDEDCSD